jgi:hypothetical protein
MKSFFWSFCLLVLSSSALRAQACSDFPCVIAKIKKLIQKPNRDYQHILDNLDSAEGFLALKTATIVVFVSQSIDEPTRRSGQMDEFTIFELRKE